jgi:hypothetical protein
MIVFLRGGAGALGASIIVHDVMLYLLIAMMIIRIFELAARLVVITAMPILVMSMVTAFVAIVAIGSVVVMTSVVATMMIMAVATIVGARMMLVAAMCPAAPVAFARAVGLGTRLLRGLLLLVLLELVEDATRTISILALLEEADEWDVIIRKHLVRFRIFLLMLFWNREKNLLDFFLLCGQLHHHPKEPFLEVTKELHTATHVVMHRHERRLLSSAKPADQLVANVLEPGKYLEIISLTFDKAFEHFGIFIQATGGDDVLPFGQADLLETLLEQWKQCWTIMLLIGRPAQNDLRLELGKRLRQEKRGSKAGLVECNASCQFLPIHGERDLDSTGLFEAVLHRAIHQPIGSQRSPLVKPVELGHGHGLEEVRHGPWVTIVGGYSYSDLMVLKLQEEELKEWINYDFNC